VNKYFVQYVSRTNYMHLIPLMYFYCDIFTYMFWPVIRPSSGWHFCYKHKVCLHLLSYFTVLSYEFQYCGVISCIWSRCILITEMSPWRWLDYQPKDVGKNITIKIHQWNWVHFVGSWYTLYKLIHRIWIILKKNLLF
jgi:hypothetical protein